MNYKAYLDYLYRNNIANLEVEKENIERRITGYKKNMGIDIALIGGSVVLTGVGIYGMYYFAPEIRDIIKHDEVIRVSTIKTVILLQGAISTSLIGLIAFFYGKAKIKLDWDEYNYSKDKLNKIAEVIEEKKEAETPKEKVLTR